MVLSDLLQIFEENNNSDLKIDVDNSANLKNEIQLCLDKINNSYLPLNSSFLKKILVSK